MKLELDAMSRQKKVKKIPVLGFISKSRSMKRHIFLNNIHSSSLAISLPSNWLHCFLASRNDKEFPLLSTPWTFQILPKRQSFFHLSLKGVFHLLKQAQVALYFFKTWCTKNWALLHGINNACQTLIFCHHDVQIQSSKWRTKNLNTDLVLL